MVNSSGLSFIGFLERILDTLDRMARLTNSTSRSLAAPTNYTDPGRMVAD
jgi:hypothetical protein